MILFELLMPTLEPKIKIFDTLDDMIADKLGNNNVPEDFQMPKFPIAAEDINSISDILTLIQFLQDNKLDNICPKYRKLVDCKDIITELNQMIGLKDPKATIATQILSLCDRADRSVADDNEVPLLNTVIYGPPGCGKTTIANFLSKLYLKFGVLDNGNIIKGDRETLIGQWVGETAIKTKKVLKKALGGILFIDEAYQLGHAADGNRCPFSYECITTITQFITEHKGKITVILAGYKEDIQQNFFAQNEGLDRRFPWKYTLEPNKPEELVQIFKLQAKRSGYQVCDTLDPKFFQEHEDKFKYSGGDTQTYFDKCKMIHDKRMFSQIKSDRLISKYDLELGFEVYEKAWMEQKSGVQYGPGKAPPLGMFG